jgi:hypothetical protein
MILGLCDRLLGEVGRRGHLFAWLRPPGPGSDDWLVVDSYYPSNRLVVVCREQPSAHDHLYGELIPLHGLRLLELAPAELGGDPVAVETALRALIAELALPPRRSAVAASRGDDASGESAFARVSGAFAQVAASAPIEAPRRVRTRAAAAERDGGSLAAAGLLVGAALALALCVELYFGVAKVMLDGGRWLLGLGILLDACSRLLGTVAAGRVRAPDWAWACVIIGSPAVAVFALFRAEGPVSAEPAPLAGLISLAAMTIVAIAVLASALGI